MQSVINLCVNNIIEYMDFYYDDIKLYCQLPLYIILVLSIFIIILCLILSSCSSSVWILYTRKNCGKNNSVATTNKQTNKKTVKKKK